MEGSLPVTNTTGFPTTQEPTIPPQKPEYFGGCRVFDVTNDEYTKLMRGTKKWERWGKYFDATEKGTTSHKIRRYLYKNPSKTICLRNTMSQEMVYFKPRSKND
jgi:hypothetical protein